MVELPRFLDWLVANGSEYEGLLFDIDGTLVRGGAALPGAVELLDWLHRSALPYLLVTNDANHSHLEKAQALSEAGLEVEAASILSAGDVLAQVVEQRGLVGRSVFVMGDLGTPDYASRAGLRVTRELGELEGCAAVIVGEEHYDWQPTFNAVINFFVGRPDAHFLVPNPDIYWPDGQGGIAIGAGAKARFIASVLDDYGVVVQPEYLGKPHRAVFDSACARLNRITGGATEHRERIIMVGDSLRGDIRGANLAGLRSALVLTGITPARQLDLLSPDSELWPSYLLEGL